MSAAPTPACGHTSRDLTCPTCALMHPDPFKAEAERRYTQRLPLTLTQTAHVLNLTFSKGAKRGQPDRRQVLDRLYDGRLRPVDRTEPQHRWTVSPAEIDRYLNGGSTERGAA